MQQQATSKTVLVVEDNDLNRRVFHDLLEMDGYNVLEAREGAEALKLVRQCPA
jgi:two-component system cell cycle response regulator DivK